MKKKCSWWREKRIYIFFGGPVSNIGKGVITGSFLNKLVQKYGSEKIECVKIDPYYNISNWKIHPLEHGEVFVTKYGRHVDLDLGYYQRYSGISFNKENCLTGGTIQQKLYNLLHEDTSNYTYTFEDEIDIVMDTLSDLLENKDYLVCEVGGTIGDDEQKVFLETFRRLQNIMQDRMVISYVTALSPVHGMKNIKTKIIQNSIKQFVVNGMQIQNIFIRNQCSVNSETFFHSIKKIVKFFPGANVMEVPQLYNIYELPNRIVWSENLIRDVSYSKLRDLTFNKHLSIGLIGKYLNNDEAYKSIVDQFFLWEIQQSERYNIEFINIENVSKMQECDMYVVLPGFGKRGISEQIEVISYLRTNNKITLGICLGFQLMIIEYLSHITNIPFTSAEFEESNSTLLFDYVYSDKLSFSGEKNVNIVPHSLLNKIYGETVTQEIFRHKFGIKLDSISNIEAKQCISDIFNAIDDLKIIHGFELNNLDFYLGIQYHIEYKNNGILQPHPVLNYVLNLIANR